MSNAVGELIQDVAYRIGEPKMEEPFTHAVILRAMNRVYQQLNEELKVIERELSIDFSAPGALDSVDDGYWHLPDDCVALFKVPNYRYVPSEAFSNTESYTFTIYMNRIYFANADENLSLTVAYLSSGYTLVDQDSGLGDTEVNEPEYPDFLQQILLYRTAIELKNDYPKFESDIRTFMQLKSALGRRRTLKQLVSVEKTGPQKYSTLVDTDDYDEYGTL